MGKILVLSMAALAVSLAIAPGRGRASAGQAGEVSFSREISPILTRRCAICHMTGAEPGRMALAGKSARHSLVGVPSVESQRLRIVPGSPEQSYLINKISGTQIAAGGSGARMPFGAPPLDDLTIAKFQAWIAAGAPDN